MKLLALLIFILASSVTLAEDVGAGFVCFGKNFAKVASEHTNRIYLKINSSEKLYFNDPSFQNKSAAQGLDLNSDHIIELYFDDQLARSWKLNFGDIKANGVKIWRSAGSWRMDGVKGADCANDK